MLGWLLRLLRGEDGFGRISTGAAMVIALGGGLGAYYVVTQGGAPAGTANLWVESGAGACSRSATPVSYSDSASPDARCGAMQTAQTAANGGDTVIVRCGTYSGQSLSSSEKASAVSYYAETYDVATTASEAWDATTCVYVEGLTMSINHIHVYGLQAVQHPFASRTDAPLIYQGSEGVSFGNDTQDERRADVLLNGWHGPDFGGRWVGITLEAGVYGGWDACYEQGTNPSHGLGRQDIWESYVPQNANQVARNTIIRNNVFANVLLGEENSEAGGAPCGFDNHSDCLQAYMAHDITITGNIFMNCPTDNMQVMGYNQSGSFDNNVFTNNYLGPTGCCNVLVIGNQVSPNSCAGWTVQNNTMVSGINAGDCGGGALVVQGGIFYIAGFPQCSGTYTYQHNVWNPASSGSPCGDSTFKKCNPDWLGATPPTSINFPIDTSLVDPHLASADTCAKDYGYSSFPALDIDNESRPLNTQDAGVDEIS